MKDSLVTLIPAGCDVKAWTTSVRPTMTRAHTHAELELNLVLSGQATYIVDGVRQEIAPGTLLWLHPAQDHMLPETSDDFRMWIAVFHPRLVRRLCRNGPRRQLGHDRPAGPFVRNLAESARRELGAIFAAVSQAENDPVHLNAGAAWLLTSAWAAFRRAEQAPPPDHAHPAVTAAARLIRRQAEPPNLAALAAGVGLSPSHLSRLFRRQTGLSIVVYRQRVMIERFFAIHASRQDLTVLAAAMQAGFGSYAQFHRVFRQHLGAGPREYFARDARSP